MSINQLGDEGAVIGYKPTLEYVKKSKSDVNTKNSANKMSSKNSNEKEYSKTLSDFSSNLPSIVFKNIESTIKNMDKLINKLASSFENNNWGQYGEISSLLSAVKSNNKEYIDKFIEYHQNEITGSIIPELIGLIYDSKYKLQTLESELKELYYGQNSLSIEEIEKIDKVYLKGLQLYEDNKNDFKVNYLAISNDLMLNRSVSMYAFLTNRQVINISDVILATDESSAKIPQESFIKKMFEEVNDELKYRKYSNEEQQNVEIIKKTLYNYYNKRQEIIDLYNLYSDNKESVFIGNRIQSYSEQVNEAIANINKVLVGNQYFLSEMAKLEREKHLLMNIYATVNYKSEI